MTIKIKFTDFWTGFNPYDNYFINLLKNHFDIDLVQENPDVLLYSVHGEEFLKYDCFRIFYCGENYSPNYFECDFSFTRHFKSFAGRNYRLPHYIQYADPKLLLKKRPFEEIFKEKTKFCNLVVSNPHSLERLDFFHMLSEYKPIDSGGRVMNNIGGAVENKLDFIRDYKFTIAFENSNYSGYTTEKLFEPMLVNSIPIYWGNKFVGRDFNERSFVKVEKRNFQAAIERIIAIDQNEDLYRSMLKEPYFPSNKLNAFIENKNVLNFFRHIFGKMKYRQPVAQRLKSKFRFIGYYSYRFDKQFQWQRYKIHKAFRDF